MTKSLRSTLVSVFSLVVIMSDGFGTLYLQWNVERLNLLNSNRSVCFVGI